LRVDVEAQVRGRGTPRAAPPVRERAARVAGPRARGSGKKTMAKPASGRVFSR